MSSDELSVRDGRSEPIASLGIGAAGSSGAKL
jgi:hypothetical protein